MVSASELSGEPSLCSRSRREVISIPSGPSSFVDLLLPPVKAGRGADEVRPHLQVSTTSELDVFELLDAGEVTIDQHAVGHRPQVFNGLQFGRVRRQKEQMNMVRDTQAHAGGFPAGAADNENDLLGGTGPRLTRALRAFHCKHGDADGGGQMGQMKERASGGGTATTHPS